MAERARGADGRFVPADVVANEGSPQMPGGNDSPAEVVLEKVQGAILGAVVNSDVSQTSVPLRTAHAAPGAEVAVLSTAELEDLITRVALSEGMPLMAKSAALLAAEMENTGLSTHKAISRRLFREDFADYPEAWLSSLRGVRPEPDHESSMN